jgi:UDP-glucose 4-epimerase
VLVAASDLIARETGWAPRFAELDDIVKTALDWREKYPDGYGATRN